MPEQHPAIRDWLKLLAGMAGGAMSKAELQAKIGLYAPMLAQEFPASAFCQASLAHVARQCRFFPSFAEVCEALSAWWKQHRPSPSARAIGDDRGHEARDDAQESWRGIDATEVRRKIRAINDTGGPYVQLHGRFLATALGLHAPQHLGLLPPQWLEEVGAPRRVAAASVAQDVKRGEPLP